MTKKARKTGKRSLALFMTILMLMSAWVFVAPTASAITSQTAGSYTFTVTFNISNNGTNNHDSGWGQTTEDTFIIAAQTSKNNGRNTTYGYTYDYWTSTGNKTWSGGGKQAYDGGFPLGFYMMANENSIFQECHAKLTKIQIGTQTVWQGTAEVDSSTEYKYIYIYHNGHNPEDANGSEGGTGAHSVSTTSRNWTLPTPTCTFSGDTSVTTNGAGTVQKTYSVATAKDQYGVNWGFSSVEWSSNHSAATIDNNGVATFGNNGGTDYDVTFTPKLKHSTGDRTTNCITVHVTTSKKLDVNGYLYTVAKDSGANDGGLGNKATAKIYKNNTIVSGGNGVNDFYDFIDAGATYKVVVTPIDGWKMAGVKEATSGLTYTTDTNTDSNLTVSGTMPTSAVAFRFAMRPKVIKLTLNNQSAATAGTGSVYYKFEQSAAQDTSNTSSTGTYFTSGNNTNNTVTGKITNITIPTKTGYDFSGYYTATNGGGTQYIDGEGNFVNNAYSTLTADTTLYAYWTPATITTTLNKQNGSGGTSTVYHKYTESTYYSNSGCTTQITSIQKPTRTGYTFGGYYTGTNGSGTQYIDENGNFSTTNKLYNQYGTNNAITLYAKWTPIKYPITFTGLKNADSTDKDDIVIQVDYDSTPTVPSGATAQTYDAPNGDYTFTFSNWNPAIAMVTGAATYTAVYNSTPHYADYTGVDDAIAAAGVRQAEQYYAEKYTSESRTALANAITASGTGRPLLQSQQSTVDDYELAILDAIDGLTLNTYTVQFLNEGVVVDTQYNIPWGTGATEPSVTATKAPDPNYHYIIRPSGEGGTWDVAFNNVTHLNTNSSGILTVNVVYVPRDHDWTTETLAATCIHGSGQTTTCPTCSYVLSQSSTDLDPNNHESQYVYMKVKNEPTCTTTGLKQQFCQACGNWVTGGATETIPALGHVWSPSGTVTVAPNCTDTGTIEYTCSRCHTKQTDTLPIVPDAHTWGTTATWTFGTPDSTTGAMTATATIKCTHNNAHTKAITITVYPTANTATCSAAGTWSYVPSIIFGGTTYSTTTTATSPALGHDYSVADPSNAALKSAATCTAAAVYYYSCSRCGAVESNNSHTFTSGAPLGHTLVAHDRVDPTCTAGGNNLYYECTRCNTYFKDVNATTTTTVAAETLPENGHTTVLVPADAPTCEEAGNTAYYYCSVCGALFNDVEATQPTTEAAHVDPATGHDWTGGVRWVWQKNGDSYDAVAIFTCHNNSEHEKAVDATVTKLNTSTAATCTTDGVDHYSATATIGSVTETATKDDTLPAFGHNWGTWTETTPATCTTDGEETRTCANDTSHTETRAIPAFGHEFGSWTDYDNETYHKHTCRNGTCGFEETEPHDYIDIVDPAALVNAQGGTCVAGVSYYKTCSVCGHISNTLTFTTQQAGHKLVAVPAQAATCTEAGHNAYWQCAVCGKYFSDANAANEINAPVVLNALGHNFDTSATPIEGTNGHMYKCTRCNGYGFNNTLGAVEAHTYDQENRGNRYIAGAATDCGQTATYYYSCVCGAVGTTTFSDPSGSLNHNLTAHTAVAATCAAEGRIAYWECSKCHRLFSDANGNTEVHADQLSIPKTTNHSFGEWETVTAATCTQKGSEKRVCSVCGKTELRETEALEHSFTSTTYRSYNDGTHSVKCIRCDVYGPAVACTNTTSTSTAADCMHTGDTTYTCTDCGGSWTVEGAYGNHQTALVTGTAADCTTAGTKDYYKCSVCGKMFEDAAGSRKYATVDALVIQPLGHALTAVEAVAATCLVGGHETYYTCSRCNKLFRDALGQYQMASADEANTDALGHDWGEWTVVTAATCEADGSQRRECARCHITETETIPAIGHAYPDAWTADGETGHKKVCGNNGSHVLSEAHNWTNIVDASKKVAGTTCETGIQYYKTCSVCGYTSTTETFTVAEAGHKLVAVPAQAATCTEAGHNAYWQCAVCDKYFSDANAANEINAPVVINALGHNFDTTATPIEATGGHMYKCTRCNGYGFNNTLGAVEAHIYDQEVTGTRYSAGEPRDCTHPETYYKSCKCGAVGTETFQANGSLGHDMTAHEAVAATCAAEGTIAYWECSRCHRLFSDANGTTEVHADELSVPKLTTHSFGEWTTLTAATCTEQGSETRTCSVCGKVETRTTNALDHSFTSTTYRTNNDGTHNVKCTRCDVYGPDVTCTNTTSTSTAADCTHKGTTTYTCTDCGGSWTVEGAYGDHSTTKTDAVAATCTAAGTLEYYKCSVCGRMFSDAAGSGTEYTAASQLVIQPLGHALTKTEAIAATCLNGGNDAYYTCSRCGKFFSDAGGQYQITENSWNTEALGHDWGEWDVQQAAACESTGTKIRECARCHLTETDTIPATGHNWGAWTDNDNEETHIRICGNNGDHTETQAHTWTNIVDESKRVSGTTCETGIKYYKTCSVCGYTSTIETFTVAEAGHKTVYVPAVAPTCTADGTIEHYECALCGNYFSDAAGNNALNSIVDSALGHDFDVNGIPVEHGSGHYYKCTRCGEYGFDGAVGAITNHIYDQQNNGAIYAKDGSAADCTHEGEFYYSCKCGKSEADDNHTFTAGGSLGHVLREFPAVTATCKDDGHNTYWYCSRCGNYYKDANANTATTLEAETISHTTIAHTMPNEWTNVTPATCLGKGSEKRTCTVCEAYTETQEIPALGHDFEHGTVYQTYNNGTHAVKCTRCDVYNSVLANCADTKEIVTTTAADCTHLGTTTYRCTCCGYEWTEENTGVGSHSNTPTHHAAVPATCTTAGNIEYWTCEICGQNFSDEGCTTRVADVTVAALAHAGITAVEQQNPDCTHEGVKAHFECPICHKMFSDVTASHEVYDEDLRIPALGHIFYGEIKDDENGETHSFKCTRCNAEYGNNQPHSFDRAIVNDAAHVSDADCLNPAKYHYSCVCGAVDTAGTAGTFDNGQALGHVLTPTEAVPPTCEQDGNIAYWTCSRCNKIFDVENPTAETQPITNTVDPALGHNFVMEGSNKVVLDNEDGTHSFKCSRCDAYGAVINGVQTLKANGGKVGCTYSEWKVTTQPTCTTKGVKEHTCTICGHTETAEVDYKPHNIYSISAVDPTCLKEGNIAYYYCATCRQYFSDEAGTTVIALSDTVLPKLPHDFTGAIRDNGDGSHSFKCSRCSTYGAVIDGNQTALADGGRIAHTFDQQVLTRTYLCSYADCYNPIKYYYSCTCGAKGTGTFTPPGSEALGHNWVTYPAQAETCTQVGHTEYQECSHCHKQQGYEIVDEFVGHGAYKPDSSKSGASADGSIKWDAYSCERGCGDYFMVTTITSLDANGTRVPNVNVRIIDSAGRTVVNGKTDGNGELKIGSSNDYGGSLHPGRYDIYLEYVRDGSNYNTHGTVTFADGKVSGSYGKLTPYGGNASGSLGGKPTSEFRCSMCDLNDSAKNKPVYGWFISIIHAFVHAISRITSRR